MIVIRIGSETILVDAGGGTEFMPSVGQLAASLEAAGITPASLTKVIFTHAHAD
ncbi:MAG: MBL fold metallo-hydrolase, partial [Phycisphaerae bacterium]|nr:MBL fold metallo-hydrolase [Phycisphaerae bacterium]